MVVKTKSDRPVRPETEPFSDPKHKKKKSVGFRSRENRSNQPKIGENPSRTGGKNRYERATFTFLFFILKFFSQLKAH